MEILQRVFQHYHYVFDELSDPRTKSWWLMEGPRSLFTILAVYLFFCSYAGPQYMKDRKPYQLKRVIMIYNLIQIVFSLFLTYRAISFVYSTGYSFRCHEIDYSDSPEAIKSAGSVWWYFLAKITELLDTIFFVLRKKNNQVSFLHLYHHTLMPMLAWFGTKFVAGGQSIPEGGINAFIHILMYGYYFVAGLGPQYQKYLWWKKYLTIGQLIQFSIVLYLNTTGFFDQSCKYPKPLNLFIIFNCLAFLYMFGMFYYRCYVNNGRTNKLLVNNSESRNKNSGVTNFDKDS